MLTTRLGTVIEFDEAAGLGTIESEQGVGFDFHCIEIADGTRSIAVGQRVTFEQLARFGRFQAGSIRKV